MRSCSIALLFFFLPAVLPAQADLPDSFQLLPPVISARVEKFKAIDQASLRMINNLAVDHAGFLWCATSEGLARFDGYEARVYRDDPADTSGRFNLAFNSVAVDRDGFVWGGSSGVVKRLDPSTRRSRLYMGGPGDTTAVGPGSIVLLVTSEGELWAGGSRGIARYNRERDSFVCFPYPPEFRAQSVYRGISSDLISLCEIGRCIWVGSQVGGIARFGRDDHTWKLYRRTSGDQSGPSSDMVFAVSGDRSGALWVGSDAGLERYDPVTNTWRRPGSWRDGKIRIPRTMVSGVVEDDYGGLWIATVSAGIFRIDPVNGHLLQLLHDPANPEALPYNTVWRVTTSRGGGRPPAGRGASRPPTSVVWVPHGIQGVSRIIVRNDACTRVLIPFPEATTPPSVRALVLDPPGKVWAGILNDVGPIALFDLDRRTCRWYPGPAGIARAGRLSDGSIMVTTRNAKVWMLDTKRDAFYAVAPELNALSFLEEKDGSVWLGCHDESASFLALLNRHTGRYTIYPRKDSGVSAYRENAVTRICADDDRYLWYGTSGGGLIRFDRVRKTYQRYASHPGSPDALVDNTVIALVPDSAGKLWVGTQAGLDLMDRELGTFEHMHSSHPAGELLIREMVDDGQGHLWIVTLPTVACFTKEHRTFRWVQLPEEYRAIPVPWGIAYDPASRVVTVGVAGGFFMFPADNPPAASDPPPVVLTSFNVFEKPYPLQGEVWSLMSITLPHSASFFSFTFAALDYLDPAKNQYSYRLEGVDPDWVQSGSRRYVSYSNLDPGRYVLKVKGTNSEGIWNEKGTSIEILVQPPWYRTLWAYGAYMILAGAILYVTWRLDRRRTALKHSLEMKSFEAEKMREVDQMKSRFFANISHEFRTPLTLILGPVDQLLARSRDEESHSALATMKRNGLRLLQLINQLLDLSRMDAGRMSVQVRPLDLVTLARPIVMSFVSLAERKKIQLIFDPEEDEIIAYTDRDKFEKILSNLLSNAFKFTGDGGEIRIALRLVTERGGRSVEIVVADSGIGIAKENLGKIFDRFYQVETSHTREQGGTGIGLALTKELVEVLKGEITVKSEPGCGSTFTVGLPTGKEHWSPAEIITEENVEGPVYSPAPLDLIAGGEVAQPQETGGKPGEPVILIVEDNADVRAYIRGFLHENYGIEEAANGSEALEKVRETTIDLVISDIMMPVMDGIELCRTLKSDDRTSHIPVILLTARASGEGKQEGLYTGADDYIIKPFDAWELMARARNLIELRRKLREKYVKQLTLGPSKMQVTTADERFLKNVTGNIETHIADAGYDTGTLAHDMCMSRMQLNRKLHALTGHSTHELVREFRLQRAAELIHIHADNISGVAYEVGFNSLSHFARAFRERFGVLPSEYEAKNPPQIPKPL